ncbi:MAG: hypothetical protein U9N11_08555, partial [Campylobacterota bacterium]|nr:hypothetical protein [Campylobacterota bacterium]
MERKVKYFPIETIASYDVLHKSNMVNVDNIIVDRGVSFSKKKFYSTLSLLAFFRKLKYMLKALGNKNSG